MTPYTVKWMKGAENHLASLWVNATDREAVQVAADQIDAELAVDPAGIGRPVSEGLRGLDIYPLRVLYSVNEVDKIVEVASVRRLISPEANGAAAHTG